jgi:hypothetical protein
MMRLTEALRRAGAPARSRPGPLRSEWPRVVLAAPCTVLRCRGAACAGAALRTRARRRRVFATDSPTYQVQSTRGTSET